MIFRIPAFQALLLAALVFGLLPAASAQSGSGTRRIIFSSPEGQITSNAPVPMVQAPAPREKPDLPAAMAASQFPEPLVGPMYPLPVPMLPSNARSRNSLDSRDVRKEMGVLTSAQIMNVPSKEQIFGLPDKKATGTQKEPWQLDNENENRATNNPTFDTTALIDEPTWAKTWTDNNGKSPESSNTTERASGFFGRFFDNGQNDDDVFGNRNADGNETFLGSSQPAAQQSSWDSGLSAGGPTPSATATPASLNSFTAPAGSGSGFASQSPFATPQVSTLDTMPKLPSLPSLPGQNSSLTQPASTPSWTPKPPPWTQSQTPFGTPAPFNQSLKR